MVIGGLLVLCIALLVTKFGSLNTQVVDLTHRNQELEMELKVMKQYEIGSVSVGDSPR